MIHWGDTGSSLGRSLAFDTTDDIPVISPIDRPSVYAPRPAINGLPAYNGFSTPRPRRDRAFRRQQDDVSSNFSDSAFIEGASTTPTFAPALGPDGFSFLNEWRGRYGDSSDDKENPHRMAEPSVPAPLINGYSNESSVNNWRTRERDYQDSLARRGSNRSSSRPTLDEPRKPSEPIDVKAIDMRIQENAVDHHTDEFEINQRKQNPHLVLRRGQPFQCELQFGREFKPDDDQIEVVMEIGKNPRESNGTRLRLPVQRSKPPAGDLDRGEPWWAELASFETNYALICIHIGSNAIIGEWNLKFVSSLRFPPPPTNDLIEAAYFSAKAVEYVYPIYGVFILFNPWCKDDQVYMAHEYERDEYVLNDVGKIWRGSHNVLKPTSWVYGQFEAVVIEACMMILEKSFLPMPMRSSPIHISRVISAMVNAPDDNGVLVGNWSGNYQGGTAPTEWTGSTEILRRYAQNGGRQVEFGQCWVFAGVTATICRCLGLPCRVVSNYSSAHDTDTSVTVDFHLDTEGRPLKKMNTDSVWNFHVWNDVWMSRPDLPENYGGWQAIDATPQEKSDGVFQAGPAPLAAVKDGRVGLGYDTAFIFAEVNADKCYWLHNGSNVRFIEKQTDSIGRLMSTKSPGRELLPFNKDRDDITHEYKYFEGSKSERMAVMTALFTGGSHAIMAYREDIPQSTDVKCELDLKNSILIGKDFNVNLSLENMTGKKLNINVSLRVDTIMYMGTGSRKVKVERSTLTLMPFSKTIAQMTVRVQEYLPVLMDQAAFQVTAMAHVKDTGQLFTASDDFRVQKPDIEIKLPYEIVMFRPTKVVLHFTNPLPVSLTNCKFILDGPGLTDPRELYCRTVAPHAVVQVKTEIRPWKSGKHSLMAHFTSTQLSDVDGYTSVDVSRQ